jgi:hypothetical protein
MADLAVEDVSRTGLNPTFRAVSESDTFTNDGETVLEIRNAGGSPDTVTIAAVRPCKFGKNHDISVSVPATTGVRVLGPFPPHIFNNSSGKVTVEHSFTTSVTMALMRSRRV